MISVTAVDADRWNAIARGFGDYTYEQNDAYAQAAARRTGSAHLRVEVQRGGATIGAACVRLKKVPMLGCGIAYIPSGPLIGNGGPERLGDVLRALSGHFRDGMGHVLRIRLPVQQSVGASPGAAFFRELGFVPTPNGLPYRTVLLDPRLPEETLRSNLHSKWRNQLKRAEKADLQVEFGRGPDFIQRFSALYGQMREFKTFSSSVDPAFLQALHGTGFDYEILIAKSGDDDVAGHVTCSTPQCATYVLGATNAEGRKLQAGSFLNWQALLSAGSRDCRWFDLGGIDRETNPDGYRFKTRMGGEEVAALGPFDALPPGFRGRLVLGLEAAYRLRGKFLQPRRAK